jgi:hypothetical protein
VPVMNVDSGPRRKAAAAMSAGVPVAAQRTGDPVEGLGVEVREQDVPPRTLSACDRLAHPTDTDDHHDVLRHPTPPVHVVGNQTHCQRSSARSARPRTRTQSRLTHA